MSEHVDASTVSLEFIGRRLDAVQADTADIRRRMIRVEERLDGVVRQIDGVVRDVQDVRRAQSVLEERMSAMVDRQSKLEHTTARTLFLMQRLALKIGGIEDDT